MDVRESDEGYCTVCEESERGPFHTWMTQSQQGIPAPGEPMPMVEVCICAVCYQTGMSNIAEYPRNYGHETTELARWMARIANMVLKKLEEG